MSSISLLNKRKFKINDNITIHIPTVGELRKDYKETGEIVYPYYLMMTNLFLATSCDIMIELDEQGIDFTKWTDYNTFLTLYAGMTKQLLNEHSYLIFDNLNLADFDIVPEPNGKSVVLKSDSGFVLDERTYMQIGSVLTAITGIKKNHRKMGNETAKQYAIERAKAHRRHSAKRIKDSMEMSFD